MERRPRYDADVLVAELPYERQSTAFEQFVAVNTEVRLLSTVISLWSPCVIGQTIMFLPCGVFFHLSFFSLPNLSSRRLDVSAILPHTVWP